MEKSVSSSDVAREAGVSRATVSYVLNGVKDVKISDETRAKVLQAAERIGYHPNSIARALKTNQSMSIGIFSNRDLNEERFAKIVRGIKRKLQENNYSLTICSDHTVGTGYVEYIEYFLTKRIDGIILIDSEEPLDKKVLQAIEKHKIPTVLVDYHLESVTSLNSVDMNYYQGAYMATKYIIENNHEKIIYFAPTLDIAQETERLRGVKTAVKEAGDLVKDLKVVDSGGLDYNKRKENMIKILSDRHGYTAVIVSWEFNALEMLSQINELQIKVPEEISIIALAGTDYSDYAYPPLTTCDLPLEDTGYKSAQLLIESLREKTLPARISLPCSLNIRKSVRKIDNE